MQHFFYVLTNVKWKMCSPYYFFLLAIVACSPSIFLYETNLPYEGGHFIAYSNFKTCAHFFKRMKPAYILDIKHTVNSAWKISPIASKKKIWWICNHTYLWSWSNMEWICKWFIRYYSQQQWHTDQFRWYYQRLRVFLFHANTAACFELRQSSV